MPVPDVGWDRDDLACREDIFLGLRGNHGSARKNEQCLIVFMRMGTVTRTRFKKDHQHGNFTRPSPNLNKLLAGYTLTYLLKTWGTYFCTRSLRQNQPPEGAIGESRTGILFSQVPYDRVGRDRLREGGTTHAHLQR